MVFAAPRLGYRVLDAELEPVSVLTEPLSIGFTAAHPPALYLKEQQPMFRMRDDEI